MALRSRSVRSGRGAREGGERERNIEGQGEEAREGSRGE
jgi:hypothetical protein